MQIKKTVLLIDDDKEEYELFSIALESYNKNVSCIHTYDCTASFSDVQGKDFDYIFLDFNLPVLNGFECLKTIKKNPSMKSVPLFMYSASTVDDTVKKLCLDLGAVGWIGKPKNIREYHEIFDKILQSQS